MIRAVPILALAAIAACHGPSRGDAVRDAYDNHADAVENAAAAQPTSMARHIYQARADALREEGRDRQKGLDDGESPNGGGASR